MLWMCIKSQNTGVIRGSTNARIRVYGRLSHTGTRIPERRGDMPIVNFAHQKETDGVEWIPVMNGVQDSVLLVGSNNIVILHIAFQLAENKNIFRLQHLHRVSSCERIDCLMQHTHIHSRCICKVFLQYVFYCGVSMWLPERLKNHSVHIY